MQSKAGRRLDVQRGPDRRGREAQAEDQRQHKVLTNYKQRD